MAEGLPVGCATYCNAPSSSRNHPPPHMQRHMHAYTDRTYAEALCLWSSHQPPGNLASSRIADILRVLKTFCILHTFPELSALWRNSHGKEELLFNFPCNFLLNFYSSWPFPSLRLESNVHIFSFCKGGLTNSSLNI